MTDPDRTTRPRPGSLGSQEFLDFLAQVRRDPRRTPAPSPINAAAVELGTYESDAGEGHVWVRIDSTGETVRAALSGFLPEHRLERGDELGAVVVGGAWRTIPTAKYTIRHHDRIEFWTRNRRTGGFRQLATSSYEQ